MKTLTVFTPTFNRKHTICRTYESLCRQTSQDFDWLIVDDGSSDGTREWVKSLGEIISPEGEAFDWMGSSLSTFDSNHFVLLSKDNRETYDITSEGKMYIKQTGNWVVTYVARDYAFKEKTPNTFQSALISDCIAKGKTVQEGGARWNWTGPQARLPINVMAASEAAP